MQFLNYISVSGWNHTQILAWTYYIISISNKIKNKKYHTVGTFTKSNRKVWPSWSESYDSWIYNLPVQSVPITTKVVSLNPVHGEVYSIHYVTKFVRDCDRSMFFFPGTPVSSTNKTDRQDIAELLLKMAPSIITLIPILLSLFCRSFFPLIRKIG